MTWFASVYRTGTSLQRIASCIIPASSPYRHGRGGPSHTWRTVHTPSITSHKHIFQADEIIFFHDGAQQEATDLRLGRDLRTPPPPTLASLFVYSHTELVMGTRPLLLPPSTYPTHPPPHYLLYLMGPLLFPPPLSPSTFIYIFIHSTPALRVTVFNIIGETWLLPLNAEITGAFFLSSSPLHFSRVAPRGRNIFISPCAPSFKTFTPAVWKIFLIFLPHGVEKSP